jgi:Protein of unknown function (DUF4007)
MRSLKFHQGFKLDRTRLATLLRCMIESQVISKKVAATCMGVGEPAAEGCIGWLLKTGLGTAQRGAYMLTPLGTLIAAHDPHLSQPSTLWLLHYYLVTEHDERAEVWYRAFNEFLSPGTPFTRDALQTYVERSLDSSPANKSGVGDDCNEFGKCYTEPVALGKLDLVREVEKKTYEAGLNSVPEPQIFAFALFDAWQRRFPHADTLRVTQICREPEMPGRVFVARHDQVVQVLQSLQSMGLVNIVDSQHEPVTRRFRDMPHQLIANFYTSL